MYIIIFQPVQIIEPDESSAIIEDRCKRTRMNSGKP